MQEEGKRDLHVRKTRRGTYALDKPHASASASVEPVAGPSKAVLERAASVPITGDPTIEPQLAVLPSSTSDLTLTIATPLSELSALSTDPEPEPEPERATTPTLDDVPPYAPSQDYEPVDLDSYKPDALTAHFPTLARLKDPETIARMILRRDDLKSHSSTRGLPPPSFHPLLERAAEVGRYPPEKAFKNTHDAPVHFLVSPLMVDPKSTTFDFFDCGKVAFPHDLVKLDVKQKIAEMVLLRGESLSRRTDWRGLPWPEWSPLLVAAQKQGRYPKFPVLEKRGEEPVFYASRALVDGWWGEPAPLAPPHPVGFDIPEQQLVFLTEYEWRHIEVEPEIFGLDETSDWEGLPWPETSPILLAAARAKKYPIFPEIDDRGAPPRMRDDRTYAVFDKRLVRRISNDSFRHTFAEYAKAWKMDPASSLPRTYEIPRAAWDRICVNPDDVGLGPASDWRGLPWPETSPVLLDAVRRGTYPVFPPVHLRGAQPRSYDGKFCVFDRAFAAPGETAGSDVEDEGRASTVSVSTAPTSVVTRGTPSPSKKRKGKEKEKDVEPVKEWWDDGKPRCATCKQLHTGKQLALSRTPVDCCRCRRHLIIYGSPWPKRLPPPGTRFRSPTPSESEPSSEEEEEEAPPPRKSLAKPSPVPKHLKRPAPDSSPAPSSIADTRPLKRRRTEPLFMQSREERMAARNKAREDAEHAERERDRQQIEMARAFKRFREDEEIRYRAAKRARLTEDAVRRAVGGTRLGAAPTPAFFAKRKEVRDEEDEEVQREVFNERQQRVEQRQKVCWRMPKRLGGLGGGARNPLFFARRRAHFVQVDRDADDEADNDDDEDHTPNSRSTSPTPLLLDTPVPPAQSNVFTIPVPPWMEGGGPDVDEERRSTLLVRVVS
ncbi:hypothetical protein EXIGLDRAFT_298588 [Exidia glandulosa HHB12029]|uniref:Uncharacterized protein n=1 Tax=Exidia glandulosa HHB12029 TaxID=1314781 RepID=A0A166B7E1_EXIGL|nr:hypothetical protein EXIGLDRAFT_298588 [Exidia glandulosa HHB12029]